VAMADGPHAGLKLLEPLLAAGELDDYAPLHIAHADLLRRIGHIDQARAAYSRALEHTANATERAFLQKRLV
jgi:RNA polymerase sigma-70 factor, ECF subfamily